MSSIYTVCKKWKNLIELVLIEEIEFRLKNKLLIEVIEIIIRIVFLKKKFIYKLLKIFSKFLKKKSMIFVQQKA